MLTRTHMFQRFAAIGVITFTFAAAGCGGSSSNKSVSPGASSSAMSMSSTVASSSAVATSSDSSASSAGSASSASSAAATISITGAAVGQSADVATVATLPENIGKFLAKLNPIALAWAAVDTGSSDNDIIPNATVTLYKIKGGGQADEQVDIGTITTDSNGAFTIPAVEKVPAAEGTDDDFYYEVRVSKGQLSLKTPIAADENVVANISPETDLAAKILTDVVAVPGVDDAPLPSTTMIESIRELVLEEAATLTDDEAIQIPSALSAGFDQNSLSAANGLAANGGNAEKLFKSASFSAEQTALVTDATTTDEDATGYINRVIREGCDQSSNYYLPQPVAASFGAFFNADGTVTPAQIITAYNANFSGPDLVSATVLQNFKNMLTDVADKLEATAVQSAPIDDSKQLALYTMRSLDAATFDEGTALDADQALAFIQTLGAQQCQFSNQLNVFGFVADLLNDNSLRTPAIASADIYHNSGFGCDEGVGKGHFVAEVKVNRVGKTITSVTVASSDLDTTVLGGDGVETLAAGAAGLFDTYNSNSNGICVNLGKDVDYTVTVNFSDATTATASVNRNHPRIPEASSQVFVDTTFVSGSNNSATPSVVSVSRPLYKWTSPTDMLNLIANDAANTAVKTALLASDDVSVKYTYEFAHVDTQATPVSPAGQCPSVSSGALYSVDSFIPTEECDVTACAAALGVTADRISCRMNIQSFLVDKNDKILGQAAGHFRFFCVDLNDDGDCGA